MSEVAISSVLMDFIRPPKSKAEDLSFEDSYYTFMKMHNGTGNAHLRVSEGKTYSLKIMTMLRYYWPGNKIDKASSSSFIIFFLHVQEVFMDLQDSMSIILPLPCELHLFEVNNSLQRERERVTFIKIQQLSNPALSPVHQFTLIFQHQPLFQTFSEILLLWF